MKSKIKFFKKILLLTTTLPICSVTLTWNQELINKFKNNKEVFETTRTQEIVPYFNFKGIKSELLDSYYLSTMTLDDILAIPYNSFFYKNESEKFDLFSFEDVNAYNNNNYKYKALINFYINDYASYNSESLYENYKKFINNYFEKVDIVKYPTIGTIRVNLKLKANKVIKFISINENFSPNKKINLITDNFSFSIVNFKTEKEIMIQDESVDISNTKLSEIKANELTVDDLKNNLFQFADSQILRMPLLVTNYTRQKFESIFDVEISNIEISRLGMELKADILITTKRSMYNLNPYPGGIYKFRLFGFKTNFYINQRLKSVNISNDSEFKNIKASEFINISNKELYFEKFLNKYINYSDTPSSNNALLDTDLTSTEFKSSLINPIIEIDESSCNDVNGEILNAKLKVKYPLNYSGTIYEEQIFTFNIIGFKKDVNILINNSEFTVNETLKSTKVKDVDENFVYDNLIKYNSDITSNNDLDGYLFSTNTNKLNIKQYAIKNLEIIEKNEIEGYIVLSINFLDSVSLKTINELLINNQKSFTFRIKGFKKEFNIYQEDMTLSIKNEEDLFKYEFLNDDIFKSIDNIQMINKYLDSSVNREKIIKSIFLFEYDKPQNQKLFATNANYFFLLNNVTDIQSIQNKTLGIITVQIIFNDDINGVYLNGSENNGIIEFKIVDYPKEFTASWSNIEYINKDNFPELSNFSSLTEEDIFNSNLFNFSNNLKTNFIISTDITLNVFKENFLKNIILYKEKSIGSIHVVIELYDGFIENKKEIIFTIYNYFPVEDNFIDSSNINDISVISEYKNFKPSMFKIDDVYNFINFKNNNKKYSILNVNVDNSVFKNIILKDISLKKTKNSITVNFKVNEKGIDKNYISTIKGFKSDLNFSMIISLSICIPILIILIVCLIIYIVKRNKIKKEIENE